jgi:hypothetical protein
VPVLLVTGEAGAVLPPGVGVIGKPFELDTLARRVQAILETGRRVATGTAALSVPFWTNRAATPCW